MTLAKEIIQGNECGRTRGLGATDSVLLGLNNSVLLFGLYRKIYYLRLSLILCKESFTTL